MVTAKFQCESVQKVYSGLNDDGSRNVNGVVKLRAVSGTDEDNKQWSKWTPTGELSMVITTEAWTQFEPGQEYMLDIYRPDEVKA